MKYRIQLNSCFRYVYNFLSLVLGASFLLSCSVPETQKPESINVSNEFSDYWFAGKAELTSYKLSQARYGEIHPGSAVLIFVTEDFSNDKQVKLDNPQDNVNDVRKVMKLNSTRKFNTGVYPYSMMKSVFTPLNFEPASTLKITASSQEWCGHTFAQLNSINSKYSIFLRSYFESEGDVNQSIDKSLLEDEIWTNIRVAPDKLPVGEIQIIPGLLYSRLSHRPSKAEKALASLEVLDTLSTYKLKYEDFDRELSINYNSQFPYEIYSWEESYTSGFGSNARKLETKAVADKRIMLDYWSRNNLADSVWRHELNLP